MTDETVKLKFNVSVALVREGKVIQEETVHNVTCNAGIAKIAAVISAQATASWTYIAVGTVNTSPAATDTALGGEVLRVQGTTSLITTTVTNDTAQLIAGFIFSTSYSIKEAGLFDTASTGTGDLLGHVLIGPYSVVSGDSLTVTWQEVVG